MAESHYLTRRGSVWHYFRRVPLHLVASIGRRFIKQSLGTSDFKEAKARRNALNVAVDARFAAAEKESGSGNPPCVTLAMVTEHLRAHVAAMDERAANRLISDPPQDGDQLAEMKLNAHMEIQILRDRDDPRGDEWVAGTTHKLLKDTGASLSDTEVVAGFAEIVRRGLLELDRRKLDRYEDRFDKPFHDPLFDPARPPAVSFGELADIFLAERLQEYALNKVSEKRADKVRAEVATVREMIGDTTPVHKIDDDTVQAARQTIARTPLNRGKTYPGMPLAKQIERGERDGKGVLSPVTQSRYLDCLRDILTVGVRKKFLPSNPAQTAKPIKKDATPNAQKRLPWSPEQLAGFFTGSFYKSCAPGAPQPYTKRDRDWRYWMPLIMLFTGARPEEICQLNTADVKQTPAGVWYLDCVSACKFDPLRWGIGIQF